MKEHKKETKKSIILHPALDFTKDFALVAIPKIRESVKSGKKEYLVVTSDRESFRLSADELIKRGFYSRVHLFVPDARWSENSIEKFLSGNAERLSFPDLYFRIKNIYKEYLDYQDQRLYSYLTIWVMGTYFYPLFYAYPINHFSGTSGSGKSKTVDATAQLAFNSINSSNISDASIFRIVEGARATVLLDENEKISEAKGGDSQLNLLLAGFKKGAKIYRAEKDNVGNFHPVSYEIYSPKIIANIRGIQEEALKNRAIQFIFTPAQSPKTISYPTGEEPFWQEIRDQLYLCLMGDWQDIIRTREEIIKADHGLTGYNFMQWHPILSLAKLVGEKTYNRMLNLAREKSKERSEEVEDRPDRKLLVLVYQMFKSGEQSDKKFGDSYFFATFTIYSSLVNLLDYDEDREKWLTPYTVGKMLSNFNIGKGKLEKINGKPTRGIWINKNRLESAIKRFGFNIDEL